VNLTNLPHEHPICFKSESLPVEEVTCVVGPISRSRHRRCRLQLKVPYLRAHADARAVTWRLFGLDSRPLTMLRDLDRDMFRALQLERPRRLEYCVVNLAGSEAMGDMWYGRISGCAWFKGEGDCPSQVINPERNLGEVNLLQNLQAPVLVPASS
jgi:hypothetical protein